MTRKSSFLGAVFLVGVVGCAATDESQIPGDALTKNESFVPIARPSDGETAAVRRAAFAAYATPIKDPGKGGDFYLAISKKELGKRWFLTGYLRDAYPFAGSPVDMGAASSLGTRVVSFKVQNDKLFVFDVRDGLKTSDLFDPQILVEAYPLVHGYAPFEGLTNHDQYVLFDPSAGLNKFALGADPFYDFFLSSANASDFTIGISFMQGFRKIDDNNGVSYEELFTGQGVYDDGTGPFTYRASGTLEIALRKYYEGDGFTSMSFPSQPYYFQSDWKLVPDTGGADYSAVHWNIKKGMKPITFLITPTILDLQAQNPDVDLVGAVKKGVENWNDVFGFQALEAKVAGKDDVLGQDDKNFIAIDASPAAGYAFANWRTNPNTGEIRGATVYVGGAFFDRSWFDNQGNSSGDSGSSNGLVKGFTPPARPTTPSISWQPLAAKPLCAMVAPKLRPTHRTATAATSSLTPGQQFEAYITHVVLHEVGHTLGLRHNFMGSLANNSVMDYLDMEDSMVRVTPGEYDAQAIKYLYGLSPDEPTTAFCTDGDVAYDPDCEPFDAGADPLHDTWAPYYEQVLQLLPDWGFYFLEYYFDDSLNGLLNYARGSYDPNIALEAYNATMEMTRNLTPENLADSYYTETADEVTRRVFQRLYLDPPAMRGYVEFDLTDPGVIAAVRQDLSDALVNTNKINSFDTRRVAVDVLKEMQTNEAYAILRQADVTIQAAKALGGMSQEEAALTDDLLARIDAATHPYFRQ